MNMRILGLISMVGLLGAVCSAQNVSVNYDAGSGSPVVVGPDGSTALANGNDVELGYFSGFTLDTSSANSLSALAAARQAGEWHLFPPAAFITSSFILPAGSFTGSGSQPASANFSGNQIDLWIFQTPGGAAPAADLSNVTAWGIFSSTINISASRTWTFPAASIGGVDNITTSDLTGGNGVFYHGQISPGGQIEVTGVAVPEPGTAVLAGLGMTCVLFAVRRLSRT